MGIPMPQGTMSDGFLSTTSWKETLSKVDIGRIPISGCSEDIGMNIREELGTPVSVLIPFSDDHANILIPHCHEKGTMSNDLRAIFLRLTPPLPTSINTESHHRLSGIYVLVYECVCEIPEQILSSGSWITNSLCQFNDEASEPLLQRFASCMCSLNAS